MQGGEETGGRGWGCVFCGGVLCFLVLGLVLMRRGLGGG